MFLVVLSCFFSCFFHVFGERCDENRAHTLPILVFSSCCFFCFSSSLMFFLQLLDKKISTSKNALNFRLLPGSRFQH